MSNGRCCFIAIALWMIPSVLSASCGSASCPLNNHRYLQAGFFNIMYSHEYINQDRLFIGSSRSYVGALPGEHDEVQTINQRDILDLQFGLADRVGISVAIPFITRQHDHIHHDGGGDTWEHWGFSGLGDVIVSGQYSLVVPSADFDPYLTVTAGVKLANGLTHVRNEKGEEAEVTIQPGTGSVDGIFGLYYRQPIASLPTLSGAYSALPLTAGISYQITGVGSSGYRFGNSLLVHVGTSYQFSSRANFLFQINGRFQGRADVGSTGEPRENTGGAWIFASPGFSVDLAQNLSAYGYVQVPLFQNVNGIQQTASYNLQLGLSASVGLLDKGN